MYNEPEPESLAASTLRYKRNEIARNARGLSDRVRDAEGAVQKVQKSLEAAQFELCQWQEKAKKAWGDAKEIETAYEKLTGKSFPLNQDTY